MNAILSRLMPKEPKFYPLLRELANTSVRTAEQLIACIEANNRAGALDIHQKIKDLEHDGDRLINKIFRELNVTFITPFDREDINSLGSKLDDVIDEIYGCAKRILFYKPQQLPPAALKLAHLIKEAADCLQTAVADLESLKKNHGKIARCCRELHNIEGRADEVYQTFVTRLFAEETNAVEIIKLKEIISELEAVTDETDFAGKIIKSILVKYT